MLPPDLLGEVEDFIEFLIDKRRSAELEQIAVAYSWPPGLSKTARSIDDPTFVRHAQGEYGRREPF